MLTVATWLGRPPWNALDGLRTVIFIDDRNVRSL